MSRPESSPRLMFLTGSPGVGKSTIISRVVEDLAERRVKVGGITTRELREGSVRVGFEVEDLGSGRHGVLAHVDQRDGPSIGKYRVRLDDLVEVGVAALEKAVQEAEVIVIDEVGPMELSSELFKKAVGKALDGGRVVLGTLQKKAGGTFVENIRSHPSAEIIEVTLSNRIELAGRIVESILRKLRG